MGDCTITYENIILGTYETEHILLLELEKGMNTHAQLHVTAIIPEEKAEEYVYMTGTMTPVALGYVTEDNAVEILFRGTTSSIQITRQGEMFCMDLYVKGNTWAMDIIRRSRSFQNTSMTVRQLIQEVMATAILCCRFRTSPLGG